MPRLFRRSWEQRKVGHAGQIISPLPSRSGSDGVIYGGNITGPSPVGTASANFISASASFVSTDVGRKIRLEMTIGNRYDEAYVIDSVISSTVVALRKNHNVGGTPKSPARFLENCTQVVWTILPSCTFIADEYGDIQSWDPGSYLTVRSAKTIYQEVEDNSSAVPVSGTGPFSYKVASVPVTPASYQVFINPVTSFAFGTWTTNPQTFTGTLTNYPVLPGSVKILDVAATVATDTGTLPPSGTISGSDNGSTITGTVNYETGAISVTFTGGTPTTTAITCKYGAEVGFDNGGGAINGNVAKQTSVTGEAFTAAVGTPNGIQTTFTHTATNTYVVSGSVRIFLGAVEICRDDIDVVPSSSTPGGYPNAGSLIGTTPFGAVTGTINYLTGAISITFSYPPPESSSQYTTSPLSVSYKYSPVSGTINYSTGAATLQFATNPNTTAPNTYTITGDYVGTTSVNNQGQWNIAHQLDGQSVILNKSWYSTPIDYGGTIGVGSAALTEKNITAVSTPITVGVSLPSSTITVQTTSGFSTTGGSFTVASSANQQTITYTGTTATTFTGCVGGSGTVSVGALVIGESQGNSTVSTSYTFTLQRGAASGSTAAVVPGSVNISFAVLSAAFGTGTGSQLTFGPITLGHTPIVPGTFIMYVNGIAVVTDAGGSGASSSLFGPNVASGTINYTTGSVTITFINSPSNNAPITVSYSLAIASDNGSGSLFGANTSSVNITAGSMVYSTGVVSGLTINFTPTANEVTILANYLYFTKTNFASWPNESFAQGNGSTVTFTHTALHTPIIPGTLTITAGAITGTDNGAGAITGSGIVSGTSSVVNYLSGLISVQFSAAPSTTTVVMVAYTSTNYASFKKDDSLIFLADTNLEWYISDREPYTQYDFFNMTLQSLIDCGWQLWQQRGPNTFGGNGYSILQDIILFSPGEPNSLIPGGKNMYMRLLNHPAYRNTTKDPYQVNLNDSLSFAMFPSWDVTLVATGITQTSTLTGGLGSSAAGMRIHSSNQASDPNDVPIQAVGTINIINGILDYGAIGAGGFPAYQNRRAWTFFGDRDEVVNYIYSTGAAGDISGFTFSFLQSISGNQNVMTVMSPISSGGTTVNVGITNPQTLVPPYSIGDNLTIIGYRAGYVGTNGIVFRNGAQEFVETTTITGFNTASAATLTIGTGTAAVIYTANTVGSNGNTIQISQTTGGVAGVVVSTTSSGVLIAVTTGSDTAAQVATLVNTAATASAALVTASTTGGGSGTAVGQAATNLSGGANYTISVLPMINSYGNGTQQLLAQCGEDPFPIFGAAVSALANGSFTAANINVHNVARFGDPVGGDYPAGLNDATTGGSGIATTPIQVFSLANISPNRRSSKFGLSAWLVKYDTTGEVRGRARYFWFGASVASTAGNASVAMGTKIKDRLGNVYVCIVPYTTGVNGAGVFLGPMPPQMALVY